MTADDQVPVRHQSLRELGQDAALQILREVGERQVATENEMEGTIGHLPAQILLCELDAGTVLGAQAERIGSERLEGRKPYLVRELAQAAAGIDRRARPLELLVVGIGAEDTEVDLGEGGRIRRVGEQLQGVGFLAGAAAGRPDTEHPVVVRQRLAGQIRQDLVDQDLEYTAVTREARDGDATETVEDLELLRMRSEEPPVGRDLVEAECAHASRDAFADLAAHLAESGPAESEARESRQQQVDALAVAHWLQA